MKRKTNPLGPGTANVSVNMPTELKTALEKLAKASEGMKLGAYCRRVLERAATAKVKFTVTLASDDSATV